MHGLGFRGGFRENVGGESRKKICCKLKESVPAVFAFDNGFCAEIELLVNGPEAPNAAPNNITTLMFWGLRPVSWHAHSSWHTLLCAAVVFRIGAQAAIEIRMEAWLPSNVAVSGFQACSSKDRESKGSM